MALPDLVAVRRTFPRERVGDVERAVRDELRKDSALQPGMDVAIAVGSRGIAEIAAFVKAVVGRAPR